MTPEKSDNLARDIFRNSAPEWNNPAFTGKMMQLITAEADRKIRRKFFWRIYAGIAALAIVGFAIAVIVKAQPVPVLGPGDVLQPIMRFLGGREVFILPLLILLIAKRMIDIRMRLN